MGRPRANESTAPRNVVVLFAGLFAVEGLCALTSLQRLPFDHYGKDVAGWPATHLASMHALLALPWAVKPLYGALSDNVPLFGSLLGLHMPVWSVLIAFAVLLALAAMLAALDGERLSTTPPSLRLTRIGDLAVFYVIALCLINLVSAILQCGFGACHTTGYAML